MVKRSILAVSLFSTVIGAPVFAKPGSPTTQIECEASYAPSLSDAVELQSPVRKFTLSMSPGHIDVNTFDFYGELIHVMAGSIERGPEQSVQITLSDLGAKTQTFSSVPAKAGSIKVAKQIASGKTRAASSLLVQCAW